MNHKQFTKNMVDSVEKFAILARVAPANTGTSVPDLREKFLRFQLGPDGKALLPLDIIYQVMRVPKPEILPVPQMPNCVLGIYNWRGEMLWLVDIGQMMGFGPVTGEVSLPLSYQAGMGGDLMAIAIQVNNLSFGLIVPQINDIELHDPHHLLVPSIGLFPPEVVPYLKGYLIGANNEVLMVVNAEAIAKAPLWKLHLS